MDAYVNGKHVRLDPSKSVGKGGEADVFDIGNGRVLKLFKPAIHPDFDGFPDEQKGAKLRIAEHQKKLPAFPKNLPSHVITPLELAMNDSGNLVVGYTMPFLGGADVLRSFGNKNFRSKGVTNDQVVQIFSGLHKTVGEVHNAGVVIGDFNDLNILVKGTDAYLIDADSYQFGNFLCRVFTAKFVDPLICDPNATSLMMSQPHNVNSDWYAFNVMLMNSLLYVDPYGGVYRPKDKKKNVKHDIRPLHRITVFDDEVRYPKPAIPFMVLPDDMLQHFYQVFLKDQRGEFPLSLIENLRWTTCTKCKTLHARGVCPTCAQTSKPGIKETVSVRGTVISTRQFQTDGVILYATVQNGILKWLYHEKGTYRREDGSVVMKGDLDSKMRYRIKARETLIGKQGQVIALDPYNEPRRIAVDSFNKLLPVFDANSFASYWVDSGQIKRDDQLGPKYMGNVL